uniref:Uncharacterized protein n=1 Tax=Pararge aegeria TaxID=116150 RepID=S4NLC6_9NEOP
MSNTAKCVCRHLQCIDARGSPETLVVAGLVSREFVNAEMRVVFTPDVTMQVASTLTNLETVEHFVHVGRHSLTSYGFKKNLNVNKKSQYIFKLFHVNINCLLNIFYNYY